MGIKPWHSKSGDPNAEWRDGWGAGGGGGRILVNQWCLGKTKARKDRAPRADSSQRQLCGVPPNPSHHGAFELTNPLTWGHESFTRVAGHAGFWHLCLILAVAGVEKQALRAEEVMVAAAQHSKYAEQIVNPRTYSPGTAICRSGKGARGVWHVACGARRGVAWHGVTWPMAWRGVPSRGMAWRMARGARRGVVSWHDMAWHGMV